MPTIELNDFLNTQAEEITPQSISNKLRKANNQQFLNSYMGTVAYQNVATPVGSAFGTDSKYDQGMPASMLKDVGEYRGQVQSTADKWANASVKMAITAGTTFLDGTIGTVWGLGELLAGGSFVNNQFSNAMADISEWQEKVLPNYYTREELETPWYTNLGTANFWADKVLKNFGFTVGAVYSGMAWSGVARQLPFLATKGLQRNIAKGVAEKFFNGSIDDALKAVKTGKINPEMLTQELIKDAKSLARRNAVQQVIGATSGAIGESRIESISNAREFEELKLDEIYANLSSRIPEFEAEGQAQGLFGDALLEYVDAKYNDEKGKELLRLKEITDAYRNVNFLMDFAVLSLSNWAQFKSAFGGGYNIERRTLGATKAGKKVAGELGTLERDVAKGFIGKVGEKVSKTAKIIGNPLSEGLEEMSQGVVKETGDDFFGKKFDGDSSQTVMDYFNTFAKEFVHTATTPSKWEEFFIGMLMGGPGVPIVSGGKFNMSGGIWGDISDMKKDNAYTEEVINKWNEFVNSDRFKNNYQGLVRHLSYQKEMDKALDEGDVLAFKNAEHNQFVGDVITAIEAGQFDALVSFYEGLGNSEAEILRDMTRVTKDAQGNTLPQEQQKSSFDGMSDEDVKSYYRDRGSKLAKNAKLISELRDAIEVKFGGTASKEVKEVLLAQMASIENTEDRIKKINSSIPSSLLSAVTDVMEAALAKVANNPNTLIASEDVKPLDSIVEEYIKNNPKDSGIKESLKDLIVLHNQRIQLVDQYNKMVTEPGLADIQQKAEQFQKDIEDAINAQEAAKFTDDVTIVDRKTQESVGVLRVVDGESRLHKFNPDGSISSEYEVVNPKDKAFLETYGTLSEEVTPVEANEDSLYVYTKTGAKVFITPHPTKENTYIATHANKNNSWEVSQEKLDSDYKADSTGMTKKLYVSRKDATPVIVYDTGHGKFKVKETITNEDGSITTKFREVTKEQLNKDYIHKKTFESARHSVKKNRSIQALENLINNLENKISQLEETIALTEPIEFLRQEVLTLQQQVESLDRRSTQKTTQKILNKINQLNEEIDVKSDIIREQEKELEELKSQRTILYENLQRVQDWQEGQESPIRERIEEVEQRIKDNDEAISAWKKVVSKLKGIINSILESLGLSKLYQDLQNVNEDRKIREYRRNRLKAINESLKKAYNPIPVAKKLQEALNQIEKFQQENNELLAELEILEEFKDEYLRLQEESAYAKYGTPVENIPILDINTKGSATIPTMQDAEGLSNETLNNQEENLRDARAKRPLEHMYTGLAGRHFIKDDKEGSILNQHPDQRRYYRFTSRMNLSSGKFSIKLEFGDALGIPDKPYNLDVDKKPIRAYFVNEQGQYVDEFGKPTTDKTKAIYTFMLSAEYAPEVFQPKEMSDTDFQIQKDRQKEQYIEVKKKIIAKLEAGEEVTLPIVGKSAGVPRTHFKHYGENKKNSLSDVVENKNDVEIVVATTNSVTFSDGTSAPAKSGFVYGKDKVTGNIIPLTPRKLNNKEIDTIVSMWKMFLAQGKKQSDGTIKFGSAGILHLKDRDGNLVPYEITVEGKKRPATIFDYLQAITFFTGNNLTAEASKLIKEGKLTKEEAYKNEKFLINKNKDSKASFYFVPSSEVGGMIRMGDERAFPLMQDTGRGYEEHKFLEKKLRDFLATQYVNVNSILTNDRRGFPNVTAIKKTDRGEYYVEVDMESENAEGYNNYLLNSDALESRIISKDTLVGENTENKEQNETMPQISSSYAIYDMSKYADPIEPVQPKRKLSDDFAAEIMAEEVAAQQSTGPDFTLGRRISPLSAEELAAEENLSEETDVISLDEVSQQESPEIPTESSDEADAFRPALLKESEMSEQDKIDLDKATKWLKKVLGDKVAIRVSRHMLSGNNWGRYRDAIITLYENAGVGTEFHEAFHAVMDLFYSPEEKTALFETYKRVTGNNELTSKQIEEELAEDFANYMLGNSPEYIKKSNWLSRQLDRLWNFIKGIFNQKVSDAKVIKDVFDNINSGKYAGENISSNKSSYTMAALRTNIPGLSVYDKKEILEGVNAYFFQYVFQGENKVASLFDKQDNSEIINEAYKHVKERLEAKKKEFKLNSLQIALDNFTKVVEMHKEYLQQYNLEFVEEDWNKNVNENDKVKDSGETWARESLKYSAKHNASRNIKLLMGSIPSIGRKTEKGALMPHLNSLGLPILVDFGKAFNITINKMSTLTDWTDMESKLKELAIDELWAEVLMRRLGVGKDIDALTPNEFILRSQFQQTMAKNENNFYMDTVEDNQTTIINSNQNSFTKRKIKEWENKAKELSRNNATQYTVDKQGKITYNKKQFEGRSIKNIESALRFLKLLGIEFSNEARAKELHGKEIADRARGLLSNILKGDGVLVFKDSEGGNSYEDLNTLSTIEKNTTTNAVENSLFNIDNELVYAQTLNSYLSLVINEINNSKSLDEVYTKLPHLKSVLNSLTLEKIAKGGKLSLDIHEGSKQIAYDGNKKSFDDLKPGDRLRAFFHNFNMGKYPLLRPADNSIERFINFGKFFTINQITQSKHLEAFTNYLRAELLDALDLMDSNWNNINKNLGKGIVLDMIKSVDSKLANEIQKKVLEEKESVNDYISRRKQVIEDAIHKYIKQQIEVNKKLALDNLLVKDNNDGTYTNYGIPYKTSDISSATLNGFITDYTVNSLVAGIEQTKLFIGNPMFYKSVEDEFKRHSGMVGTKKISITSDYMNRWIENFLDNHNLSPFTNEYYNGQPVLRTSILQDVAAISNYQAQYATIIGDSKASKYGKMDEGDAQGYVHLSEYRRMLVRAGDWSFGKGSLEEAYQYQIGRDTYINPKTGKVEFDIDAKRVKKTVFNPLKPQHFGPLAEDGFIPGFYKLSVLPLLPRVIGNFPNLKALNAQMELQKTGLVVFASGNKVGTKLDKNGAIQSAYTNEGTFAFNESNQMVTQDTYYKYWGIQVDMGNKSKNKVVWGTQMAKQVLNNLFRNGQPKEMRFTYNGESMTTQQVLDKYLTLNTKRIQLGFDELVNKLGLTLDNEGNIISKNPQEFIDALKDQAISDGAADNIIDAIEEIEKYGIDTAPNRRKLENILMSLADKTTIAQKTFGKPLVQVSTAFFEKTPGRKVIEKNNKRYFTSNDLKFYDVKKDAEGNISSVGSMEVYLPTIYKGVVETGKLDSKLLRMIGFRIPTQGLNSIESIIVKGFLDESVGDIVVLPTEIVAKAGSDFDIDKLNLFIPNTYRTKKGEYKYITDNRQIWESYQLDALLEEGDESITWKQWQKKAVENELMELMHSIILSPDNAQQLLSPNQVDPLKDAANRIEYLEWKRDRNYQGKYEQFLKDLEAENEGTPYNKIVELQHQMDLAERFLGGKAAVGITAVHSTFHILAQQNGLFILPNYMARRMENGSWAERPESTKINMPHNNSDGNILLGETEAKDADKSSIVEELSMWINAAVDAAKDPFMFKLNAGPQTLNVVLYLSMAGVPRNTIAMFMNQPIVKRYLELQNKYETLMADSTKSNKGTKYRNELEQLVLEEFGLARVSNIEQTKELTDKVLESEILNKGTATQAQVLYDFMRYQDVSKLLGEAMRAVTYDTNGAGKSISEMILRLESTSKATSGIVGNFSNLMNSGFIAPYYKAVSNFGMIFREYVPHLKNPKVIQMFKDFMQPYFQPNVNIPFDDIVNAMDKFKEHFLINLIMTQNGVFKGIKLADGSASSLNKEIDRLFRGNNTMANKVLEMKKKFPRNTLLENLLPVFNKDNNGIDNVKMYMTKLETVEANQLTQDWIDLLESEYSEFATDLIKFIILQSGLENSPINFINLVPAKKYNELIGALVDRLGDKTANLEISRFKTEFAYHNMHDKTIVPRRRTAGFDFYTSWNKTTKELELFEFESQQKVKLKNPPIRDFKNNSTLLTYGLIETNINGDRAEVNNDVDSSLGLAALGFKKPDRSKKNITEEDNSNEHDNQCITPY